MECNKLFVYGTLKRGNSNHYLLTNLSKFIGDGVTKKEYAFYKTYSGLPFILKQNPFTNVKGEVYEIDEFVLESLDVLEGNPTLYKREIIEVKVNNVIEKAWCYILNRNNIKNLYKVEKIENGEFH